MTYTAATSDILFTLCIIYQNVEKAKEVVADRSIGAVGSKSKCSDKKSEKSNGGI